MIPILFNNQEYIPNEQWKFITDDMVKNIQPYYYISTYGRVYSNFVNRILKSHIRTYYRIQLYLKDGSDIGFDIHRLMLLVFYPNPNSSNLVCNHKDANKLNNHISNLEWMTYSENTTHAFDMGIMKRGEDSASAVHTNNQVDLICQGLEQRLPFKDIAEMAGLIPDINAIKFISSVKSKIIWKSISSQYDIPSCRNTRLFTDEQIHEICKYIILGLNNEEIIEVLGYNLSKEEYYTTLCNIRSKRRFVEISDLYFDKKILPRFYNKGN